MSLSNEAHGLGVNLVGYFDAVLGLGESARLIYRCLEAAGVDVVPIPTDLHWSPTFDASPKRSELPRHELNLVCVNGDMFLPFASRFGKAFFAGRSTIAYWYWELEALPAVWRRSLELVDEVWVASEFTRRAMAAATDKPVRLVPPPVPERREPPSWSRAELGIPDAPFVFGFVFDFFSTAARKNPEGVVDAFCRAFRPGEGPVLMVKMTNAAARKPQAAALRARAQGRPDVVFVDRVLPPEQMAAFFGLVDCYVSLHRSEGFGLTLAEAMAWGTPVIATGWSGNAEFMSDENAYLVPWSWSTVPLGAVPYPEGARWAEPDLDAAAALMRRVVEQPEEARARGRAGQATVRQRFALAAASRRAREALAAALDRHRRARRPKGSRGGSEVAARPGASSRPPRPEQPGFVTVVTRSHLPMARVLARSLADQLPGSMLTAVVVDLHGGSPKSADSGEAHQGASGPLEVVGAETLLLERAELHRMAAIYSAFELCNALKPWALELLIRRGCYPVVWFDADIWVLGPIDELIDLARRHQVVLTPHLLAPIPRDGFVIDEDTILGSGIYNMGFLGLGPTPGPVLEYWKERLARHCVVDKPNMRFVDQRFADLFPALFDCAIVRRARYNVAYWNLHERDVTRAADGTWLVDGEPLGFFHFSGYDPNEPEVVSKYQVGQPGRWPRIVLRDRPALHELFEEYRLRLLEEGHGNVHDPGEYGFARMANGVPLDATARQLYRIWLLDAERLEARRPPDPFEPEGAEAVTRWLAAPIPFGPPGSVAPLGRWLAARYVQDAELKARFPEAAEGSPQRLVAWASSEADQGRLDPRLIDQAALSMGGPRPAAQALRR